MMWDTLYYVLIFIGIIGLGAGSIYLKRKFNLKDNEVELMRVILKVVDFIAKNFEFKFNDNVSEIVKYSFDALEFVEEYEEIEDNLAKLELVKQKAFKICVENGITTDPGTVEIVDKVAEYICENYRALLDVNKNIETKEFTLH